jgi:hypothetical protein
VGRLLAEQRAAFEEQMRVVLRKAMDGVDEAQVRMLLKLITVGKVVGQTERARRAG